MAIIRLGIVLFAALTLSGCLMVEVFEYHIIINPDGKSATAESIYKNIEGTEAGDQFEVDFNELIASWKGNQYVTDRLKEGVRVTERSLTIENGIMMGRQLSVFTDSSPGYRNFFVNDTVHIALLSKDIDTIMQTNGTVHFTADSAIIAWPRSKRDFSVALRFKLPGPGISFVPKFREYLSSQHQ